MQLMLTEALLAAFEAQLEYFQQASAALTEMMPDVDELRREIVEVRCCPMLSALRTLTAARAAAVTSARKPWGGARGLGGALLDSRVRG